MKPKTLLATLSILTATVHSAETPVPGLIDTVNEIETRLDARIGIYVQDEETGRQWAYRADERFPLNSTFKILSCAALLGAVDEGNASLDTVATWREADLVTYSPVTEDHDGDRGMTLDALCDASTRMSDNTAANLVLHAIGGPGGLTQFLRTAGDAVTRLDRYELELNEGVPGDPRDTTSPRAMAESLRELAFGDRLSAASRARLVGWLQGNEVSDALFRAGVPGDWVVGDRTGAGGYGSRGIAAILWPPGRAPVIATAYITESSSSFDERNAAIAEIGRAIAAEILSQ